MQPDPLIAIHTWLQARQTDMTDTLGTLVRMETPTGDKARIDAAQAWLAEQLADLEGDLRLIKDATGNHQRFELSGQASTRSRLVLGHIDTVWNVGTLERMPWRVGEQGGEPLAFGPGAYDMKAGLVITLFALRALQAVGVRPPTPLVWLITADEEIGSRTSRALIEAEARGVSAVFVVEPPLQGGALKTARKGVGRFVLTVTGKAAHAGVEPEKGTSAVVELAHQILALQALNAPQIGTTVNVGVITGGTRANVVAEQASAEIDLRVSTLAEGARLVQAIRSLQPFLPGAQLTVAGDLTRPPFERTQAVLAIFERASALAARLGLGPLRHGSTGGGSDGNFTAALGIPTLDGLGADGAGAHAPHEHIRLHTMPQNAALLAGLLIERTTG